MPTQPFKHVRGGKSVGRRADRGLEAAQRLPGLAAELAVERAAVETTLGQQLLQFQPFEASMRTGCEVRPSIPKPCVR